MTTPEPGQHVWIEVEISPLPGGWMIRPVTALGSPGTVSMSVQSMRQHPTDDPRQSLGHGTIADAFAGLDALSEALRMAASPPQSTQDHETPPDAADQPTRPRDDPGATQGAGRDWAVEVATAIAQHLSERDILGVDALAFGERIAAALGLHNLEQAAAWERQKAKETAEAIFESWKRDATRLSAELLDVRAERDAARRELQQLRDEIEKICTAMLCTADVWEPIEVTRGRFLRAYERDLRAVLAATHNNQENQ